MKLPLSALLIEVLDYLFEGFSVRAANHQRFKRRDLVLHLLKQIGVHLACIVEMLQPLPLVLDRLNAHTTANGLENELTRIRSHPNVDEVDDIGPIGIPTLVKAARAHQDVDVRIIGVQTLKESFILKALDNLVSSQLVFQPTRNPSLWRWGSG